MVNPHNRVAHKDVIRPNARGRKCAEKFEHFLRRIINSSKKNRLATDRNPRLDQKCRGLFRFNRHFIRTIELGVDPDLFRLPESPGEPFCNPRRICADGSCADANNLNLIKRGKSIDEFHHLLVGQSKDVAARKKDISHGGMRLYIEDARFQVCSSFHDFGFAEKALARAMAAIHEAPVGRHNEDAVGETLLETFDFRGMSEFAEGIDGKFGILPRHFFRDGVGINLACEARRFFR